MNYNSPEDIKKGWNFIQSNAKKFDNLSKEEVEFIENNSLEDAEKILKQEGLSVSDFIINEESLNKQLINSLESLIKENPDGKEVDIGLDLPFKILPSDMKKMKEALLNNLNKNSNDKQKR